MIQPFQKLFGVAVANTEHGSDSGSALRCISIAIEPMCCQIVHRERRFRRIHGTARLFQGQADGFRRRLFYTQIVIGNRVFARDKGMFGIRKAFGQILANLFPCSVRVGQDDNTPFS